MVLFSSPFSCYGGLGRSGLSKSIFFLNYLNFLNISFYVGKKTDLHHCSVHMAVSCFLTFSRCLSAASTLCNIDGKQGDRNPQGAQRRRSHTNGEGKRLHSFLSESLVFLKLVDPCIEKGFLCHTEIAACKVGI